MKTVKILLTAFLAIFIVACNNAPKKTDGTKANKEAQTSSESDTFKVQTNYHTDGKTVKEKIEIIKIKKDGKDVWVRHGLTQTFYKNGKLQAASPYVMGKREGLEVQYYADGVKPYYKRTYKNSKKDGVMQKFYRSGNLMSETPYKQNMLGTGSQDYADKKENTKLTMPVLKVWADDKRRESGTYTIYAKVVDKYGKTVSRVEFKQGTLLQADGRKFEHRGLKKIEDKGHVAFLKYYESTGFPETVSITARVTTSKGTALLLNKIHVVN